MRSTTLLRSIGLKAIHSLIAVTLTCTLSVLPACNAAFKEKTGPGLEDIRINQIGYYPSSIKKAIVVNSLSGTFELHDTTGKKVYAGNLEDHGIWDKSGEQVKIADFSAFATEGKYSLFVADKGESYRFYIKPGFYNDTYRAALKSYYYQRCSMPLEVKYAGIYARATGHPDTICYFHPSTGHTTGTKPSPKGWYDAGDYNKYIINAGVTLGMMLDLAEQFPNSVPDGFTNIPESGNGVSDLLDEIRYELDWVLTMQDKDGGVFNKLTNLNFDAFEMPEKAVDKRYFVGKSTTAALDFAANTAQASRVFKAVDKEFAQKLIVASEIAFEWALKHPDIIFENPKDVSTGSYGDKEFKDEFFWAASELFVTTVNKKFLAEAQKNQQPLEFPVGENWRQYIRNLGYFRLADDVCPLPLAEKGKYRKDICTQADILIQKMRDIPFHIPLDDFQWGSNSDILDASMLFCMAWKISNDRKYFDAIIETTDYIFGKNATGYCFITGLGSKCPMNIHHRPSGSDGIAQPVPGLLVGGPNRYLQDISSGAKYASKEPAKCYSDMQASYASNEVAINWNAPLVFVLGFLQEESGNK
jgi:endoglucanase